jgi:hypothetical protein
MQLNSLREEQELEIKKGIKELYHSMHPVNLLKKLLFDFASDKQVQFNAKKIGLNLGSDFLIGKILGSNMNIKKYLSSLILQKASDYVLNNHPEKVAWGIEKISNLFRSFSKKEKNEEEVNAE